jgi:predicted dehydrogenase
MTVSKTLIDDTVERSALTLGMVGGGHGSFFGPVHRAAMRLSGRWRVAAGAFSSDRDRSIASGRALGVAPDRIYGSGEELADREAARPDRIDAAVVVTPNSSHFEACRALLRRRIPTICDKPMTADLVEANALVDAVASARTPFAVTYTYAGYPMVRQARELVRSGALGPIRLVHVEYLQEWLAEPVEKQGNNQAAWRLDPKRAGLSGALGDIGTHAFQLVEYVTGMEVTEVAGELHRIVEGRQLDDNGFVRMRLANGANGLLWASQVASGVDNALRVRVFGQKGNLDWRQEEPNTLSLAISGEPVATLVRAKPYLSVPSRAAAWLPAGAPDGYLEALAAIYSRIADAVAAGPGYDASREPGFPTIRDGWRGMAFVDAAVRSSRQSGEWIRVPAWGRSDLA